MSAAKGREAADDRIPSYEESIAATPARSPQHTGSSAKNATPFQQRLKQQRQRRIASILLEYVEPCIASNLEEATNDMSIILLASDAFDQNTNVTRSSITSPTPTKPTSLIRFSNTEFTTNFLTSWPVVQELSDTLIRSMVDPSTLPQLQAQLPEMSSSDTSASLPERPAPKSWFKRAFAMPGPDHDPTGQTGKWNLGWKSEENTALTSRTITTSEVTVRAKLVEVSFRTESALGLLESSTVKCLWLDVLFRA